MNELITEDTLDLIAKLETYDPEGNINDPWVVGFRHVLEWKGWTSQDQHNPYWLQSEDHKNYEAGCEAWESFLALRKGSFRPGSYD